MELFFIYLLGELASVSAGLCRLSTSTLCLKNIPNIFDCNLKKDYQILIIFGKNIPETTGHQIIV